MERLCASGLALGTLLGWSVWSLGAAAQGMPGEANSADRDARRPAVARDASAGDATPLLDEYSPDSEVVSEGEPLSIRDAVALTLRNNLDVEVQRFEPLIAQSDRDGAWGAYDPNLSADFAYDVVKSPNTFALNAANTNIDRERRGGVGVDQLLPYLGASVGLRFDTTDRTTNSTIQALDPQYTSSFFITAKIPLARNLIWNEPWTQVKVRQIGYRSSLEGFRTVVMDNVQRAVDSYWELVAARDQVRVAQKSLETARALLGQTQTQYEVGVVSRVEVVEAEAGVADREFNLIRTANQYRNTQDQLIDIVLGPQLSATTRLQFAPTEDPEAYELRRIDLGQAVDTAFRKRPELEEADQAIEQGEVDLQFAKNQRLPQFDTEIRYGFVGISGDGNPDLAFGGPAQDRGDWPDATDDFFTGDGADNFRVTGTFSIPIPNTTARKRVTRSQLELRRSKTRRLRLEQNIILEVRNAARTLLASAEGIEAAERRRLAAEEQLRAERIRLEHGESTPFDVLQRETDLVEAETQKIAALQAYRSAEIGLERAQGTILEFHKVEIEQVREPMR